MSSNVSLEYLNTRISDGTMGYTVEGGFYQTFINATGAASVKGTVVTASTSVDNAVMVAPVYSQMPIGVIYDNGVANGQPVRVVTYGKAQVLLKNGQSSVRGYWAGLTDVAGRMYQEPSPSTTEHFTEVGHSLESKSSGTNVLSLIQLHFN